MPRYLIEREIGQFDADDIGVTWIRSYPSEAEGKVYCEYEAPSPGYIRRHAELAGIPVTKISLVTMEIEPAMVR